jgi:tetratricopeptide (TPR) repeat protein
MPLSGLSICAVADRVVVKEGARQWQAESGQYLLAFEGDPARGSLTVIEGPLERERSAEEWFEEGAALEARDPERAIAAYRGALAASPGFLDASINLGCMLHKLGRMKQAERVYRAALAVHPDDGGLLYNLGVLLEDMGRKADALEVYQAAVASDPALADCHYNLALLCEELEKPQEAIRHMAQYRRLTRNQST